MGASLCIFRNWSSTTQRSNPNQPKTASSKVGGNGNSSPHCSSILDLIRRPGGRLEKDQKAKKTTLLHPPANDHHKKINNKRSKMRKLTLEEWLLASPGRKRDQISGGDLCVFRHSRKIHPSSSRSSPSSRHNSSTLGSKANDSFSLEPVLKSPNEEADQVVDDHDRDQRLARASSNSTSISRSQNGKLIKKVTFSEEPDIIIFYSPEEDVSI